MKRIVAPLSVIVVCAVCSAMFAAALPRAFGFVRRWLASHGRSAWSFGGGKNVSLR